MAHDMYELKLLLSQQEVAKLQELAETFKQTPEDLIAGFIADITDSDSANGEEEHQAAYGWWETVYRNWG